MGATISHPMRERLHFLIPTTQECKMLLSSAETVDTYLGDCHASSINRNSRKMYTYDVFSVNNDRIVSNTHTFNTYRAKIPERLLTDIGVVYIIYLYPSADGGMPHTRPNNLICIPYTENVPPLSTIIHELWHIHQRYYSRLWEEALRSAWSFEPYHEYDIPDNLDAMRRYNPDTINTPYWVWRREWVPIPVFTDIHASSLKPVEVWFYNVKKRIHTREIPPAMRDFFGNMPRAAFEHPYEMSAYMLSEEGEQYRMSSAYRHLLHAIGHISEV